MARPRRDLVLVPILALALAGCAGGGSSTGGSSPAPTSSPAVEPAPTSEAPATTVTPAPSPPPSVAPTPDVQGLLDEKRAKWEAPGALVLLRRDGGEWFAASGAADLDGTKITEGTRFRIASITKSIVAAVVLDAVASGKLALDDVVGDLLPGVVRPDPPITVRQLLSHTSGIFDEGNDGDPAADVEKLADPALLKEGRAMLAAYQAGKRVIASDRLLVALAETHDRYFAPGAGYHYSNPGYQLLGMVLEKVTGTPLAELLRSRIVEPLGLTHTTIAPPDTASPEMRGYGVPTTDATLVDMTDDLATFGNGGNGGVIATADDLLTTMEAIVTARFFPRELVTEMETPVRQGYGLGLASYQTPCGIYLGHAGLVNGTASLALVSPDGADGVVIATNVQHERAEDNVNLQPLADQLLCPGT